MRPRVKYYIILVKLVRETIVLAAYLVTELGIPIESISGVIMMAPPTPKVEATTPAAKAAKLHFNLFFRCKSESEIYPK